MVYVTSTVVAAQPADGGATEGGIEYLSAGYTPAVACAPRASGHGHPHKMRAGGGVRSPALDTFERLSDAVPMARAYVELPYGWGPQRIVITAWKRAGYDVARLVCTEPDPDLLIFNGVRP